MFLGGLVIIVQVVFIVIHFDDGIVYNTSYLTVYKGIPIPYFDIMIYGDGTFRLVDKKVNFHKRDQETIFGLCNDILLIGSGKEGEGGKGFPEAIPVQFVFNHVKLKPLQVIILNTPEACNVFNQLRNKGKNVLFIIHNS